MDNNTSDVATTIHLTPVAREQIKYLKKALGLKTMTAVILYCLTAVTKTEKKDEVK